MRRDSFECAGYFREDLSSGEDLELWFRIATLRDIAYTTELHAVYDWRASYGALERQAERLPQALLAGTLAMLGDDDRVPPERKYRAFVYAAEIDFDQALVKLRAGLRLRAIQSLRLWREKYGLSLRWMIWWVIANHGGDLIPMAARLRAKAVRSVLRVRAFRLGREHRARLTNPSL